MLHRLAPFVLLAVAATALAAGDSWNRKLNYRAASTTSLKITEPEGAKISVETADGVKTGTVPELFALANEDAYVKVQLTATDGATWTDKVEIRGRQQAELAVSYQPGAPPAAAKKVRTYIGKVLNGGQGCGKSSPWRAEIYINFLRKEDGEQQARVQVADAALVQFELPAGSYDARVFMWDGAAWKFALTASVETPAKDGYYLAYGCVNGAKSPTVISR